MPGLDRTGPEGKGAKTGRGFGRCNPRSEMNDDFPGRRGRGFGRFRNRRFRSDNSGGNGD